VADAAVAAGHTVEFLARIESEVGRSLLADHAFECTEPESLDPRDIAEWASERRADVVHVDTYEDQGALRDELSDVGILLSNVEDAHWGRRPADLVVDPSAGAERTYRPWDTSHRLLRGVSAIPLRSEILADLRVVPERRAELEAAGQVPGENVPLRVLIVMGGTDARNMTRVVAQWWADAGIPAETTVVSSRDDLEIPGMKVVRPGPGIARSFPHMDLMISGSGTTMWELAALGVPMALVEIVDNQRDNYAFALESGIAVGLGSIAEIDPDGFGAADLPPGERAAAVASLRELGRDSQRRRAMSDAGRALVDGRGGERIVAAWAEALRARAGDVTARRAELDDASALYDWRNDPSVRAVSRTKDELSWDGHIAWLTQTLAREDRELWIIQRYGEPVGTVRFDCLERDCDAETPSSVWEVSITVAPSLRGQGLAGILLREAEAEFLRSRPEEERAHVEFVAEMLESNPASRKLFENGGYEGGLKGNPAEGEERWLHLRKPAV
jgi:spore coat polysaccharide biosynthesis predicted glycosyltransferase SpsG/L-amino acid N-acyltransferase YncA